MMFLESVLANALISFRGLLDRIPLSRAITRRAARTFMPQRRRWLKIEKGLAKGLWFQLNIPGEWSYWAGVHERAVQEAVSRLVSSVVVFYDIGAHVGFFSFGVANTARPEARVIAFEADPENCERFKKIAVRNNMEGRVKLVEAAVWSGTSSGLAFRRGTRSKSQGGVLAEGISPVLADGDIVSVPTISLDEFIRQGNPLPDLIKIDVEGGECEVLKGAADLFSCCTPKLICEVHHQEAAQWITGWLSTKGYTARWITPAELLPRVLFAELSTKE